MRGGRGKSNGRVVWRITTWRTGAGSAATSRAMENAGVVRMMKSSHGAGRGGSSIMGARFRERKETSEKLNRVMLYILLR